MQLPHRPRRARSGFALVDVCVALAILAIAMGTLIGSVFWAMRLEEVNEETAAASQRLRTMLEGMNQMSIQEAYAAYNTNREDDPDPTRDYFGELAITDPLLIVGKKRSPMVEVSFPENEGGLDADATLLPITLRLEWEGASGPRTVEMSTVLRGP